MYQKSCTNRVFASHGSSRSGYLLPYINCKSDGLSFQATVPTVNQLYSKINPDSNHAENHNIFLKKLCELDFIMIKIRWVSIRNSAIPKNLAEHA